MQITRPCLFIGTVLFLICFVSGELNAQTERNYFYLTGQAGAAMYHGDLTSVNEDESMFGLGFAGGLGYSFSPDFSLRMDYRRAEYPRLLRPVTGKYTRRHNVGLYGVINLVPGSSVQPYLLGGVGMTFFGTYDNSKVFDPTFGPALGAGIDFGLSDRVSLFVEGKWDFILDDMAMDELKDTGIDILGFVSGGLRVNLKSSFKPVRGVRISGPTELDEREEGSFTVSLIEPATKPVTYEWDMGDGMTRFGESVYHRYAEPGSYTISVIAYNRRSQVERTFNVDVIRSAVPARIVSLRADDTRPDVDQPVQFVAQVEGTDPILLQWNFGDGTVSDETSPMHSFTAPGSYQVSLRADNAAVAGSAGVHTRNITIEVQDTRPVLPVLATIHFDFNSSFFNNEARRVLEQNVRILRENRDACVIIYGYTDNTGSANYNMWMSARRAQRVKDFYIDNGISANRISTEARGVAPEPCPTGRNACRENRRSESVTVECR